MTVNIELKLDTQQERESTLKAIEYAFSLKHRTLMLDCNKCRENHQIFLDFMEEVGELMKSHQQWEIGYTNDEGFICLVRQVRITPTYMIPGSNRKQYIC